MIVRHNSIGSISLCEIYHNWYAKKDQNVITDFGSCLYIPVNFISIFFSYRIRERYNNTRLWCLGMPIAEGQRVEKNTCH